MKSRPPLKERKNRLQVKVSNPPIIKVRDVVVQYENQQGLMRNSV